MVYKLKNKFTYLYNSKMENYQIYISIIQNTNKENKNKILEQLKKDKALKERKATLSSKILFILGICD